jgi:hypothetical protein
VAPLVFDSVLEYPLALLLGLLLRPQPAEGSRLAARLGVRVPRAVRWGLDLALPALLWVLLALQVRGHSWWSLVDGGVAHLRASVPALAGFLDPIGPSVFWITVAAAFALLAPRPLRLALGFAVVMSHSAPDFFVRPDELLLRERSFFGVYRVHEVDVEGVGRVHVLRHGTTNHGAQNVDRPLGGLVYYTREGPVGQFFRAIEDTPAETGRIAVIGLGVGAMACYAAPGQRLTYYEIDPLDQRIARDPSYFTYLQHCGKNVDVVIGDGRLTVAKEPDGAFEVLVVDAFSGDAIPAHLLTREALALYFAKLSPTGLLLLHVTNTYLELLPVVSELVADAGLHARYSAGFLPPAPLSSSSDWVVVARRENQLARFAFTSPPWAPLPPGTGARPWTDDFTNLFAALRFGRYRLATQ